MCRIVAYLGPRVRLSSLLDEPCHGLEDQSKNARMMSGGSVAGDGWGIGWFCPEASPTPGLLKGILPLWSDQNAKTATHAIMSGSIVGHARYASPNIEACMVNTPLYVMDDHLWTINGELAPWPGPLVRDLRMRLDQDHEADLKGATDAETLGALWRTHFRRNGGRSSAMALRRALREARDLVREHDGKIKTNVILADPTTVVGVRFAEPGEANSLFYLDGESRWSGGVVIASEPLDDGPGWHEVGPDTLVRARAGGVRLEPLDLDRVELRPPERQSA